MDTTTAKYIILAINRFIPVLEDLEANSSGKTKKEINDLLAMYHDVSDKISKEANLNLSNPGRCFEGEPSEINIYLRGKDDYVLSNLSMLTKRLLLDWIEELEELKNKPYLIDTDEERKYMLERNHIPVLKAFFENSRWIFGKYNDRGPLAFPGENISSDKIDLALKKINPTLIELRKGMWSALEKKSPDSTRQAAHSARELIDQILKDSTPEKLKTRKERAIYIMKQNKEKEFSESDLSIVMANWEVINAENKKMKKISHSRQPTKYSEVLGSIKAAERILEILFS